MSSRGNPFDRFEQMFKQMSRQLEEAARTWDTDQIRPGGREFGTMGIDVADRGDEFVVTADVPGFEKDEVDVRMVGDALHIGATRERTDEEREENYLRSEREHRSMRERARIPGPVDEEGIEATLRNGVLTVRLPKVEPAESEGRRIDIE